MSCTTLGHTMIGRGFRRGVRHSTSVVPLGESGSHASFGVVASEGTLVASQSLLLGQSPAVSAIVGPVVARAELKASVRYRRRHPDYHPTPAHLVAIPEAEHRAHHGAERRARDRAQVPIVVQTNDQADDIMRGFIADRQARRRAGARRAPPRGVATYSLPI